MENKSTIQVTLAWSAHARSVQLMALELPAGSTAAHAVQQSGVLDGLTQEQRAPLELGVWGRKATGGQVLRDGDRLELYRPLTVDPKVARRERFARQGARGAGLFAQRRKGAKPGY